MNKKLLFLLIFCAFIHLTSCKDRNDNTSGKANTEMDNEKILTAARKKIENLELNDIFLKSQLVIVGAYKKKEIKKYDSINILNYQITLIPLITLKGIHHEDYIYIHVHSPGLSRFGHEENYGKMFLIFLTDDKYKDGHYAEDIDFIKTVLLD